MNINIVIAFLLSLGISIFIINGILNLFNQTGWGGDSPSESRKIHKKNISNLGGIGVFVATMIAYFAFSDYTDIVRPDKLFSISILLFIVGLRDDLKPISVFYRLLLEFLCAFALIYLTNIRLTTLWGIFGITDLPIIWSYMLTSVFIVACINSYNFIDGIDGLLVSISLLGVLAFGLIFDSSGSWLWTLLCISMCGALIGFLIFNWSPARIFMGDGGALYVGTLLAFFALRVMQMQTIDFNYLTITMPHTIAFSIIAVPMIDLVVVFILRLLHGLSPFSADNRHIHHRLINLGLSHGSTTIILILINISIITFAYFIQSTGALRSIIYTLLYCIIMELMIIFINWALIKKKSLIINN